MAMIRLMTVVLLFAQFLAAPAGAARPNQHIFRVRYNFDIGGFDWQRYGLSNDAWAMKNIGFSPTSGDANSIFLFPFFQKKFLGESVNEARSPNTSRTSRS
jgi:hypothetical protein